MFEIVAHRGASFDAPENTLAAVHLAWEQAADAVEIDVHLTRDEAIVAVHDDTTGRTAYPADGDRPICELTLNELKQLDVGVWKGPQWAGERMPALSDVLATLSGTRRLLIEIKCGAEIIPALQNVLSTWSGAFRQLTLIGFSLPAMQQVKRALPQIEALGLGVLEFDVEQQAWLPSIDTCLDMIRERGLDGAGLSDCAAIDREFVRRFHAAGFKLNVWTVDCPVAAGRLVDAGIDSLTTNRPGWMRAQLARQEQHGDR